MISSHNIAQPWDAVSHGAADNNDITRVFITARILVKTLHHLLLRGAIQRRNHGTIGAIRVKVR